LAFAFSKEKVKNNSHKTYVLHFKSGAITGVLAYYLSCPETKGQIDFAFSFSADGVSYYFKYF